MASTSSTNPAYNVLAFNACDHLVALHQEITDFLHYQSHVRYAATKSLPLHTSTANRREREMIIKFLKEERACIKTLRWLLEMADNNAAELHYFFEDSPVDPDVNWGELNWGPMPQWEEPRHHRNDASVTPSASCSNRPIGYNP